MKSASKSAPRVGSVHSVEEVMALLRRTVDHLRRDIGGITEPKAQALYETSAEVLIGLTRAFDDYQKQTEPAWQIGPLAARP